MKDIPWHKPTAAGDNAIHFSDHALRLPACPASHKKIRTYCGYAQGADDPQRARFFDELAAKRRAKAVR